MRANYLYRLPARTISLYYVALHIAQNIIIIYSYHDIVVAAISTHYPLLYMLCMSIAEENSFRIVANLAPLHPSLSFSLFLSTSSISIYV